MLKQNIFRDLWWSNFMIFFPALPDRSAIEVQFHFNMVIFWWLIMINNDFQIPVDRGTVQYAQAGSYIQLLVRMSSPKISSFMTHYKTPPLRNLCLKSCHVYVPEWRPRQQLFFSLVTLLLINIWGNILNRCRRFMNKVFKFRTELALAYGVLEPLHFSCKIDTKTAKAL